MLKNFFSSTSGRYVLFALLIASLGLAARTWYRYETRDTTLVQNTDAKSLLDNVLDNLETYASKQPEGQSRLPQNTPWTPAVVPCGESVKASPKEVQHPTWKVLGVSFKEPTAFQYRFRAKDKKFEFLARTDRDCDGIYQVYHLRGGESWTGGIETERITVDNPKE